MTENGVTYRDGDAVAQVADGRAPPQPVRGLEAYAARPPLADLQRHLGHHHGALAFELDLHLHRAVDVG